ncbi:hypothetical protein BDV12DRAFT_163235 [Aspergillus spectabilis]
MILDYAGGADLAQWKGLHHQTRHVLHRGHLLMGSSSIFFFGVLLKIWRVTRYLVWQR